MWQDAIPLFCGNIILCGWLVGPFMRDAGFPLVIGAAAILSVFSLQTATIDEDSITIKKLILPLKRKILYEHVKLIEYRRPKGPVTIVIKKYNYKWWKYFSYYIYLPEKYTWNLKKTFYLLRYLKKHISGEITVYDRNDRIYTRLCEKINEYY